MLFKLNSGAAGQNISLTTKQKIDQAHLTGLTFVSTSKARDCILTVYSHLT